MNKFKSTILYLTVFTFCLVMPFSAMANPVILMDDQVPMAAIFNVENILPGDTASSSISLLSDNSYLLATKAMNITDSGLAENMTLEIIEPNLNQTYFFGTLRSFFDLNELSLGQVLDGESRQFDFIVHFNETTSDDTYQGMSIVFDIAIGFDPGLGYTSAISVEDQILASETRLAENVTIVRESNIFKKDTTWQVFASAFSIKPFNINENSAIIEKGFTTMEFSLVLLFVLLFFSLGYFAKKTTFRT